ncbi:SDR family NAD(P)-dependent oxidoreductase [Rhizorhabdus argentea]|uniref:SDR family NAD(P)-dependent oxidoreductase n=1 Tax=Rhizorhabdus argentea TaxID=1387174 RepID=UPI0030ECF85A
MGLLEGKVAIVTGAGSNMGEAAAELFVSEGAKVIVADHHVERGTAVAARIGALFVQVDVSKSAEVDSLVQTAIDKFAKLDIMFNNAGIARLCPVTDVGDEEYQAIMGVNVGGVFFGTRAAGKVMRQQGSGTIINTASTNAILGVPGMALYSASKAAVVSFTKTVAVELAPFGVRVNAICPGSVPSPIIMADMGVTTEDIADFDKKLPMRRVGKPQEVARGALFLASDQSSYVTGHALVIDGGLTAAGLPPV